MGHSTDIPAKDVLCPIGTGDRGRVFNLRMSTLTISFQYCTGGSRQCNQRKINHDIHIGSEEEKLSVFIDDMIPYLLIDNPKESKERKKER